MLPDSEPEICLLAGCREKEREMKVRERGKRRVFHLLSYVLNSYNSQDWVGPKPGAGNSVQDSHRVGGNLLLLRVCSYRKLDLNCVSISLSLPFLRYLFPSPSPRSHFQINR